jgi:hypothetical protein
MGGEMLAHAIVEGDSAWKMFSPFELVWAGGKLGRAAKLYSGWTRSVRESVQAALARRWDASRRRAETASAEAAAAAAMVEAATAVAPEPPPPEAVAEIVTETMVIAAEPEPVIEQSAEVTEGQSGAAAPAIPSEPAEPVQEAVTPPPKRRKRGPKKKKKPGAQQTLKDVSEQMVERDDAPASPVPDKDA